MTAELSLRRQHHEMVGWLTSLRITNAVTWNVNRDLSLGNLRNLFGKFCLDVDRMMLGRRRVRSINIDQRLFGIAMPEHLSTNIHLHGGLGMPKGFDPDWITDNIRPIESIWHRLTKGAGSIDIKREPDAHWWFYATKEWCKNEGQYFLSNDFHPNRNLV